MRVPLAPLAALLVASSVSMAAVVRADEIEPDRPDLSTSARPVGAGVLQLESGLAYEHTRFAGSAADRRLSVEATLRGGVTDWLEVRVDGEPFVRLRGAEDDTGTGDYTFAAKIRLWKPPEGSRRPTLGVLPFVKPAIAEAPIGSERTDFGVLALASFELPAELSLDVNAGVAALGQRRPEGSLVQGIVSASLTAELTERLRAFTELAFNTPEERDGDDQAVLHAGVLYLVSRDVALDASVLTSLVGRAPDVAVRAGVSVRFGR